MKILFLDHDGVLCTVLEFGTRLTKKKVYEESQYEEWGIHSSQVKFKDLKYPPSVKFDDFNPGCVATLNYIIEKTDCEIVVSSDWRRYATLEELQELYKSYGVIKAPIGVTPFFKDLISKNSKRRFKIRYEEERKFEIQEYLRVNKDKLNIESYCIVDDLELENIADAENCILTDDLFGIAYIQGNEGIRDEIIQMLTT